MEWHWFIWYHYSCAFPISTLESIFHIWGTMIDNETSNVAYKSCASIQFRAFSQYFEEERYILESRRFKWSGKFLFVSGHICLKFNVSYSSQWIKILSFARLNLKYIERCEKGVIQSLNSSFLVLTSSLLILIFKFFEPPSKIQHQACHFWSLN